MHRFRLLRPIWRLQLWALAFSLFVPLPSTARSKKHHPLGRASVRAAPSLPGFIRGGPWTEPSYADSTDGDSTAGEDLTIRRIAIWALGPYNGSVVVVDSSTGRILSILNQKLALGTGYQPCSTIKLSVALAALSEKVIEPDTATPLGRMRMGLTHALAHSNNYYFADLGRQLGFEKLSCYARQFGYGEKAGLNITGEGTGRFPLTPPSNGGVSMLASFGEEVSQTPLQLAALLSAIANRGTLYCLQYPRTTHDVACFEPKIKRKLSIEAPIDGIIPGLQEVTEKGTARGVSQIAPIAGKTGTCSEDHTRLGWFGAFNYVGRKLVVVVLLRGGREVSGHRAAAIAGKIYGQLAEANYLSGSVKSQISVLPDRPLQKDVSILPEAILLGSSALLLLAWRGLRNRNLSRTARSTAFLTP